MVQIIKPRARTLIMDIVVPELGSLPVFKERLLRARDLNMLQAFNHPEVFRIGKLLSVVWMDTYR